jgi:hypothetical protein
MNMFGVVIETQIKYIKDKAISLHVMEALGGEDV